MIRSLFSSSWYRVAPLKPRLRSHTNIHRHHYRDQLWYVLEDSVGGRYHRFSPAAHYVIGLMNGERSMQEIWEEALSRLGDDAPTQDETIQLLGKLHATDMLASDILPDDLELIQRQGKKRQQKIKQRLWSPLSIRVPLLDPEAFLNHTAMFIRPLFGWFGALLWVMTIIIGFSLGVQNWPELTENMADNILTPYNMLIIWLVFPVVKALHELGHAYATKVWGGEVHEIGIMFLVFIPIPYVDASSSSAFRERYRRMIVGAAGMGVEVFLAAIAMMVWVSVEPGLIRAIAYNVILIGSVSTLLFNGNPLLRFDAYYILADAINIPNLGRRANEYLGYLMQRYLFGAKDARTPVTGKGEPGWLFSYSILSFIYRTLIMIAIVLFVASKYFFIGIVLAIWSVSTLWLVPLWKKIVFLFSSPILQRNRTRAVSVSAGVLTTTILLLGLLPVPLWTNAQAVVWLPESAIVRAGTNCFADKLLVQSGEYVQKGTPLLACSAPLLQARAKVMQARVEEARMVYVAMLNSNRVKATLAKEKHNRAEADLARVQEQLDELTVYSQTDGQLLVPLQQDMPGKFLKKGELVAYVIEEGQLTARAVVGQDNIGLVRNKTEKIELKFPHQLGQVLQANVSREVPGASFTLPHVALSTLAGGQVPTDPRVNSGTRTLEPVFQFDLQLPAELTWRQFGSRIHVRFYHGSEPLLQQWYRSVRQLLLGKFGV